MGRINVLGKHIAELIAAGEVVERPSSVIKELVENSIDAHATAITVEIKNGGTTYMRITDNGCGISREDVPKAFLRHATSKVKNETDLDSIGTLGFRGEALASVCAVAKVELITCEENEDIGTQYLINGGEESDIFDAGCPKGTTIIVRELFYNVPARMKFLKKDVSEGNSVAGVIDKIALSHPEIAITFIRDGKQVLKTAGDNNLKSAIYSVYGRDFANGLMPVNYSLNGVKVTGFISKPQNARPNRNMQNFFINGRFIKSRTAMAALEEACKGSVMVGKFPSCVIHITISCEAVDVNVHPAKIEVRFINERPVFDAVYHGVKTALMKEDITKKISLEPEKIIKHKEESPFTYTTLYQAKKQDFSQIKLNETVNDSADKVKTVKPIDDKKDNNPVKNEEPEIFIPQTKKFEYVPFANSFEADVISVADIDYHQKESSDSAKPVASNLLNEFTDKTVDKTITSENLNTAINNEAEKNEIVDGKTEENTVNSFENLETVSEIQSEQSDKETNLKYIGEAFQTYIIVQKDNNSLVLIDKHAAHERIIYERLKKEKGKGYMQYLIVPVSVNLPKQEYDSIISNKEMLYDAGFDVDDFGNGVIIVRGIPQYIDNYDIKSTIEEIAGYLTQHKLDINTSQMDWIYHSISCRAAIKAGNINHAEELMEIAKIVDEDKNIRHCPHGRPVSVVLTKREIEKYFGRV